MGREKAQELQALDLLPYLSTGKRKFNRQDAKSAKKTSNKPYACPTN